MVPGQSTDMFRSLQSVAMQLNQVRPNITSLGSLSRFSSLSAHLPSCFSFSLSLAAERGDAAQPGQPSTLNPQPSTLNPEAQTPNLTLLDVGIGAYFVNTHTFEPESRLQWTFNVMTSSPNRENG